MSTMEHKPPLGPVGRLLSDQSKWCKHHFALSADNKPVWGTSEKAVRWSLTGAIDKGYGMGAASNEVYKRVLEAIGDGKHNVSYWNDLPQRKFSEVRELIERLGI